MRENLYFPRGIFLMEHRQAKGIPSAPIKGRCIVHIHVLAYISRGYFFQG